MNDDPDFWQEMANEFSRFPPGSILTAEHVRSISTNGQERIWWRFQPPAGADYDRWRFLAIKTGLALRPGTHSPVEDVWLDGILRESPRPEKFAYGPNGSHEYVITIGSLPVVSRYRCQRLALEYAELRLQAVPNAPTDERQSSVGSRIEALRLEAGISQEKLATLVEVDVRNVQKHIAGDAKPSKLSLAKYNRVLSNLLNRNIDISQTP